MTNKLTDIKIGQIDGVNQPTSQDNGKALVVKDGGQSFDWVALPSVDTTKLDGIQAGAEKNEGANLGGGLPVYAGKTGSKLNFKSIKGINGVSVTATATEIIVAGVAAAGGATTFKDLTDTPSDYAGHAGASLVVSPSTNALVFGPVLGSASEKAVSFFATSDHVHNVATTGVNGLLSAIDKAKLDSVQDSAENNQAQSLGTAVPVYVDKQGRALRFRSIRGAGNASVSADGDEIVVSVSGGGTGGGAAVFTGLQDVPVSYSGAANKVVMVNSTSNGLVFGTTLGTAASQNVSAFASAGHTHEYTAITGLENYVQSLVDSAGGITQVYADAHYATLTHTHAQADVTGLDTALAGKANTTHTHAQADITGLDTALSGKANATHTHTIADITALQATLDGKAATSHNHSSSQISDSTVAGRALLTAADFAAQRTSLGLGTAAQANTTAFAAATHTHVSTDITGLPTAASAADVRTGTDATKFDTPAALAASAAFFTLTDGATISWNTASGYNAVVTLGGNRALATPTNPKEGVVYCLQVRQDGTGSRTLSWPAGVVLWGGAGAPTLSTAVNAVDMVYLHCTNATSPIFRATFVKGT